MRQAVNSTKGIAEQILAVAQAEVGKVEVGGENRGTDIKRYRGASGNKAEGSPWCADFISYVLDKSAKGLIAPTPLANGLLTQFKNAGSYHAGSAYTPKSGDLVFFEHDIKQGGNGNNKKKVGHVGIIKSVNSDGSLTIIEGNVANARFDNELEVPAWSKEAPDLVRERVWKPGEVKFENKIVGFGSVAEMAVAKGMVGKEVAKPEEKEVGAGRGFENPPLVTPAAPAISAPIWHAVKRGDTLTNIVSQGPDGDPHMAQLRVQVRQALGGKASDRDVVAVAAIALARGSHIENINKISVNDKILAMTKEEIQKAVEDLKGAGKIDGKGHLALGKDEVTLAQIFAPKTPAVAKPSAGAAPAK